MRLSAELIRCDQTAHFLPALQSQKNKDVSFSLFTDEQFSGVLTPTNQSHSVDKRKHLKTLMKLVLVH